MGSIGGLIVKYLPLILSMFGNKGGSGGLIGGANSAGSSVPIGSSGNSGMLSGLMGNIMSGISGDKTSQQNAEASAVLPTLNQTPGVPINWQSVSQVPYLRRI